MVFHAWYSEKQQKVLEDNKENNIKYHVYVNNNNPGEEVICTEVTTGKKVYWDDAKYLGIVHKWKRNIRKFL